MGGKFSPIKALVFDVFGTVVDWRGSIIREMRSLARAVAEWQGRLAPLAGDVRPVAPPARLWRALRVRLGAAAPRSLWENLAFWRGLGLAASGAAAVLLAAAALDAPQAPAPATQMAEVYLAVLSDPKTAKPLLLATAGRHADRMQLRTLDPSIRASGQDLELWALPAGGAPASLGLVGETERSMLKLAAVASRSLADVPTLAVSLEPRGGSPTGRPTGPVLAVGPCIKFW